MLAGEGVLFERAIVGGADHAAVARQPPHRALSVRARRAQLTAPSRVADDQPTLTARLRDRGYRTAAFVSAFVLDRRSV